MSKLEKSQQKLQEEICLLKQKSAQSQELLNESIASQRLLESLLYNAPNGIFIVNAEHQITMFNRAAERLFDQLEIDLQHKQIDALNLFQLPENYQKSVPQYLVESSGLDIKQHIWGLGSSGQKIPLTISVSKIPGNNSMLSSDVEFEVLLCYVVDVSYELQQLKRMKVQTQFMQQATMKFQQAQESSEQANQLKSQFLANMSHELRTPLQSILGFADIGIKKIDSANRDVQLRYFNNIKKGGNRLLNLLNDLLDLSKLEAGKMELSCKKHKLIDVVSSSIQELKLLADEKSIEITVQKSDISTVAFFDFDKILQVMCNLLSNAIKFTPNEGAITISFAQTSIAIRLTDHDIDVFAIAVTVVDSGVGIPENELETVFDKFIQSTKTRTGGGGTGLGLAICKEILAIHYGEISVTSQENKGSQFTFLIPCDSVSQKISHST